MNFSTFPTNEQPTSETTNGPNGDYGEEVEGAKSNPQSVALVLDEEIDYDSPNYDSVSGTPRTTTNRFDAEQTSGNQNNQNKNNPRTKNAQLGGDRESASTSTPRPGTIIIIEGAGGDLSKTVKSRRRRNNHHNHHGQRNSWAPAVEDEQDDDETAAQRRRLMARERDSGE